MAELRIELLNQLKQLKRLLQQEKELQEERDRLDREINYPPTLAKLANKDLKEFATDEYFNLKKEKAALETDLTRAENEKKEVEKAYEKKTNVVATTSFFISVIAALALIVLLGFWTTWWLPGRIIISAVAGFCFFWVLVFIAYIFISVSSTTVEEMDEKIASIQQKIVDVERGIKKEEKHAEKLKTIYIDECRPLLVAEEREKRSAEYAAVQEKINDVRRQIRVFDIIQPRDFDKVGSLIYALENHYAETIPEAFRWVREKERDKANKEAEKARKQNEALLRQWEMEDRIKENIAAQRRWEESEQNAQWRYEDAVRRQEQRDREERDRERLRRMGVK